ncbi:MAG: heme-binding protein [Gammaproteobacteria bacterium]|nr:heme-binding protein [Gammaproteobacteria bacterium]
MIVENKFFAPSQGLNWQAAALAVKAAVNKAEQLSIKIHVAVVDSNGNTLAYLRMPGAFFHSESLAVDKAYTSASFGFSTGEWLNKVEGDQRVLAGLLSRPRLVLLGGGLPVLHEGSCIGGIGVSGGSEEQDEICARAAMAALSSAS